MKKIAFFSYKGGAGRTSVVYNIIPLIARKLNATPENPIVVVDLDIDSMGLSFLMNVRVDSTHLFTVQNMIDLKITWPLVTKESLFKNLVHVGELFGYSKSEAGAILFMPANTSVSNTRNSNYDQRNNATPLETLRRKCQESGCKALILDTPTGDQLTARYALETADIINVCMRITHQFRRGTIDFLEKKDRSEFNSKRLIIVPNAVPREEIYIDDRLFNYEIVRNDFIERAQAVVKNNKLDFRLMSENSFGIPEVKLFKFKEDMLYRMKRNDNDETEAFEKFNQLVDIICE